MRILLLIASLCLVGFAQSKTITVCKKCKVTSIQQGINLAEDGDSVIVQKGLYREHNIKLNKSIHLVGKNSPIIDGGDHEENIITATANDFSISGFSFENVGHSYTQENAAIFVVKSKNFLLKNNKMHLVFYAFIIQDSRYGVIDGNVIKGKTINEINAGNGVHVWKCKDIRIEHNKITNMRDGIYLEFVNKSFISNNESKENVRYGLHFMFSHYNEYHHNDFNNNGAGVAVMFSKHIKMHHNTFRFNWGTASYGLLLKEINDAEIHHNYFEQNSVGVNVDGCSRINYQNNHFVRNGWAVKFTGGCYANIFNYNNFLSNSFDLSYNSRLNDNKFEANYWSEYSGYDLDKDEIGDVPYRPVKLFSYIVNQTPETLILLRSLFVDMINFSEKVSPVFTPDELVDSKPIMHKINDQF
jgi:nitrous oxidase accessory protein